MSTRTPAGRAEGGGAHGDGVGHGDRGADAEAGGVRVVPYGGARQDIRALFELAEDSAAQLDGYIEDGRVLVAVRGSEVLGHLQLVGTGVPGEFEVKSLGVRQDRQRSGVGTRLVRAAAALAAGDGGRRLLVATATADTGNLRFYQRLGFRVRAVERDAFTPATGYPPGILVDGIPLRDRVWLDQTLPPPGPPGGDLPPAGR